MSSSPEMADLHCHLDLFPDPQAAFADRARQSLWTLAVTTTPKAWTQNLEWAAGNDFVEVGLGLHPELVAERSDELGQWERLLPNARFVGEIGLDGRRKYRPSFELQKRIFSRMLEACSETGGKILSVHSPGASSDVVTLIREKLRSSECVAVLHWFTGSVKEVRSAADAGCYFSINAAMLNRPRFESLVAAIPADRLLAESDAPFVRGNEGSLVRDGLDQVVNALGTHLRLGREGATKLLQANHRQLLSLG